MTNDLRMVQGWETHRDRVLLPVRDDFKIVRGAAESLQVIKEQKLYLASGYGSFEECCLAEFNMTSRVSANLLTMSKNVSLPPGPMAVRLIL